MILQLYHRFLDKNKPLRHPLQHIFVAVVGFLVLWYFFPALYDIQYIVYFCIVTFIVDIDGLLSIFTTFRATPEAQEIQHELQKGNVERVAILAAKNHKKFNRLLVHNIFGLLFVIGVFMIMLYYHNLSGVSVTGAILSHFLFDIWDDYYQLGHINNWFWPIMKNHKHDGK